MLEAKIWLFYNGCRVIKWQAEPAETTNMLQLLLQSTEKEKQMFLTHLHCLHIDLWSRKSMLAMVQHTHYFLNLKNVHSLAHSS